MSRGGGRLALPSPRPLGPGTRLRERGRSPAPCSSGRTGPTCAPCAASPRRNDGHDQEPTKPKSIHEISIAGILPATMLRP